MRLLTTQRLSLSEAETAGVPLPQPRPEQGVASPCSLPPTHNLLPRTSGTTASHGSSCKRSLQAPPGP